MSEVVRTLGGASGGEPVARYGRGVQPTLSSETDRATGAPKDVVRSFVLEVRSGRDLARAGDLMAPLVMAHQIQSEAPETIGRTPAEYVEHVKEMLAEWGDFSLTLDELLADGDRVYTRFTQTGHAADGRVVRQMNSVVYEVRDGRIQQYWIQIDRAGVTAQLA